VFPNDLRALREEPNKSVLLEWEFLPFEAGENLVEAEAVKFSSEAEDGLGTRLRGEGEGFGEFTVGDVRVKSGLAFDQHDHALFDGDEIDRLRGGASEDDEARLLQPPLSGVLEASPAGVVIQRVPSRVAERRFKECSVLVSEGDRGAEGCDRSVEPSLPGRRNISCRRRTVCG